MARILLALAALLALAPGARSGGDAEGVYESFHRAGLQADVAAMMRLSTRSMRYRMNLEGGEHARRLAALLPRSYLVRVHADGGNRVVLGLDGSTVRGRATLLREGSEWKVDFVEWEPVSELRPPSPPEEKEAVHPASRPRQPDRPRAVTAPARAGPAPAVKSAPAAVPPRAR